MRTRVHSWRSALRVLAPALAMLVLGGATIVPALAQGAGQLSGNWSTGAIVPALANAPELGLLRAFPGPVLLPPALPPFAGLPLAPPFPGLPQGPTADANSYRVRLGSSRDPGGNWEVGATLGQGLLGGETNCAQGASYCDAPQRESFFGLQVNGDSAVVIHRVGPDGESNDWSTYWFDDGAGATYYLAVGSAVTGTDASAYPRGKSPAHVSAAQKLASLAAKLVVWAPDNQQGNTGGTQPQGGSSQSQVITCSQGRLIGQGVISFPCDDGLAHYIDPDNAKVGAEDPRNPDLATSIRSWPMTSDVGSAPVTWVDDEGRTCTLEIDAQGARITCATGDDSVSQ